MGSTHRGWHCQGSTTSHGSCVDPCDVPAFFFFHLGDHQKFEAYGYQKAKQYTWWLNQLEPVNYLAHLNPLDVSSSWCLQEKWSPHTSRSFCCHALICSSLPMGNCLVESAREVNLKIQKVSNIKPNLAGFRLCHIKSPRYPKIHPFKSLFLPPKK